MLQYFTLYTVTETTCFIIALIFLIKDPDLTWRILILFLLITSLVEIGTVPMIKIYNKNPIPQNSDAWVYNILLIFQMGFCTLMFEHLLHKYINSRPAILTGLAVFFIVYMYEMFSLNPHGIYDYNSITETLMSVLFILYSLFFYYLLLKDESYIILKHSAAFWWVTGTLFFYFGSIACTLFYEILKSEPKSNKVYLSYISDILIVILYSCWSYSFICKKRSTQISKA
nr:magnesium-transporting ATPase (P-type) [Mucilaginibacter sp. X5P1]